MKRHLDEYTKQQGYGYRRGFVLGLTLAEAALLLLFVLMLLLVIGFERRDRLISTYEYIDRELVNNAPPGVDPLAFIESQLMALEAIRAQSESFGSEWNEHFLELVVGIASTTNSPTLIDVRDALIEKHQELDNLVQVLGEAAGGTEVINELSMRLTSQEALVRNQRGQLVDMRRRLGNGVFPNCWTNEDGSFDYILDVVLDSLGIRARESSPSHRAAERQALPLAVVEPLTLYSQIEFLNATRAVYDWSVENECRFYISVYDGTQGHEKDLYKNLMQTVEGHFYKRQMNVAPPF